MAEKYTDEQTLKEVHKTLSNPQLRQCSHCIYGADYTICAKLHFPISRFQYCGHCQHFMTNEEKLVREAKEAMEKRDKETKKDDRLLTLSYTSVEMSIIYLEHFAARIEAEYNHALKRIEAKCKKLNQRMTEEDQEYLRDKKILQIENTFYALEACLDSDVYRKLLNLNKLSDKKIQKTVIFTKNSGKNLQ